MRAFIIPAALAASVVLAGCQTTDDAIRKNLDKACAVVEVAHETFLAVSASVTIEQRYIDAVEAAYAPAKQICLNPQSATTLQVVSRVIAAGVRIYAILTQVTQASPQAAEALNSADVP